MSIFEERTNELMELWQSERADILARVKDELAVLKKEAAEIESRYTAQIVQKKEEQVETLKPFLEKRAKMTEQLVLMTKPSLSAEEAKRLRMVENELTGIYGHDQQLKSTVTNELNHALADERDKAMVKHPERVVQVKGALAVNKVFGVLDLDGKIQKKALIRATEKGIMLVNDEVEKLNKRSADQIAALEAAAEVEQKCRSDLVKDVRERMGDALDKNLTSVSAAMTAVDRPVLYAVYKALESQETAADLKNWDAEQIREILARRVSEGRMSNAEAFKIMDLREQDSLEQKIDEVREGSQTGSFIKDVREKTRARMDVLAEILGGRKNAQALVHYHGGVTDFSEDDFSKYSTILKQKTDELKANGLYEKINPKTMPEVFLSTETLQGMDVKKIMQRGSVAEKIMQDLTAASYDAQAVMFLIHAFRPQTKKFVGRMRIPTEAVWNNIPQSIRAAKGPVLEEMFDALCREGVVLSKGNDGPYSLNGDLSGITNPALRAALAYNLGK